ncbi:helix-turn-helix domain-containing protein [Paenibacillus antri]|uniref:Helix-turn-helix domain-containing protein n=1 Tax=Paenibacillus antri TaxID=2582848 RepID=A0A5R9G8Z1_9BACL|nr:AraC family transcriptional regulator [Paenibacillus antri]TLS52887.1 helix-turn-helix domain-containing protein [Paenibacillus antri]
MEETGYVSMEVPPLPYFLECGRTVFEPGGQHPARSGVAVFDLLVVDEGVLYMGEEGRQWTVGRGQSLLLLPGRHHYPFKPCEVPTSFYWIHFDAPGAYAEMRNGEVAWADPRRVEKPGWHDWFAPRALRLPKSGPVPFPEETFRVLKELYDASAQGRFASFWNDQRRFHDLLRLLELGRPPQTGANAWRVAERIEAYIKRHYAENVTNGTLAETLHFHPNYLLRCMKETFGCTPLAYLQRYRIEQAKLLLATTDLRIAEVAERVGFANAPYFTNGFKRETGETPIRFRSRFRERERG